MSKDQKKPSTPGQELSDEFLDTVQGAGQRNQARKIPGGGGECPPNDCSCGDCNDDDSGVDSAPGPDSFA